MRSPFVLWEKRKEVEARKRRIRKMYSNFLILISEHNHYHNPLHKNMIIIIAFRVEKKEYGCSPVVIWSVNTRAQLSLPFLKLVNDQSRCFSFTKLFACTFFLFDIFLKSSSLCCVLKSNKRKINIEEISLEIPLCFYNVKMTCGRRSVTIEPRKKSFPWRAQEVHEKC